jgi:hypothetical protein
MSLRDEVRAFLREYPDVLDDLRSGDVSKQYVGRTHLHRFSSESADNVARQITYVMREFDGEDADGGQTSKDSGQAPPSSESVVNQLERDYYYNESGDVYVVNLDHRPKSVVLPGQLVRDMKDAYSNWDGEESTINEICRTFEVARRDFVAIKKSLGWTHDQSPYTDEELVENDIGSLQRDLARKRERALERADQKARWAEIEKAADKWRRYKRDVLTPMIEAASDTPIRNQPFNFGEVSGDYVVVHNPTDAHLDQLNADGTGFDENRERWLASAERCYARVLRHNARPEYIELVLGNDLFNVDNVDNATSAGTRQDQSLPQRLAIRYVTRTALELVERARQVAPVRVRVVPGNHDERSCYHFYETVCARYSGHSDVEVCGDATMWQYASYGVNLFGYHHGHKVQGGRTYGATWLASKMAQDAPGMWADSRARYWFTGHLHHLVEKDDGAWLMQGPTDAPEDRWHEDSGYGGAYKGQCVYLFDREEGHFARYVS